MKHTKSPTQVASTHGHLPGEDETDNKFKVLFEREQRARIKWRDECERVRWELDRTTCERDGFKAKFNESVAESVQMRRECDQLRAENSALKLRLEERQ